MATSVGKVLTVELVFQEDRDCKLITRRWSEAFSKADGGLREGEKREVEKGYKESGRKLRRGWEGGGRREEEEEKESEACRAAYI